MRLPAGHGDCIKGKDTEGNIYRRLAGGQSGSIFPHRAHGRPAWYKAGRSLPLSPGLRLPLRRVVSEASALPRPTSELAERRRTRAGTAASSPGSASSGGCGRVALTAGTGCRAAGGRIDAVFFVRSHKECSEQKKENPACCGALDQKRLSCMISGTGSPAGFPAFWC